MMFVTPDDASLEGESGTVDGSFLVLVLSN